MGATSVWNYNGKNRTLTVLIMTPEELEHRLTVLETNYEDLSKMRQDVHELLTKFAKYEGKWGTFIMIGTALWAVFVAFKTDILKILGITHAG